MPELFDRTHLSEEQVTEAYQNALRNIEAQCLDAHMNWIMTTQQDRPAASKVKAQWAARKAKLEADFDQWLASLPEKEVPPPPTDTETPDDTDGSDE